MAPPEMCSSCSEVAAEAHVALRVSHATVIFAFAELDGLARLVAAMGDDRLRAAVFEFTAAMPARLRVALAVPPSSARH